MKSRSLLVSFLSIVVLAFAPSPGNAQILFTASLDGAQETPPNTSHGTGTAWVLLSSDMSTLTYRVTYAGLDSTYTASHFHGSPPGVGGPVEHPITFSGNTADGSWSAVPDSILQMLFKGNLYVNIHSRKFPAGEIRGQLMPASGMGFTISLDAGQETPPTGESSTGTGFAYFDSANVLKYRVTIAGLSAAYTGSHFHFGAAGSPGPVVEPVAFNVNDSTADGSWQSFPDSMYAQAARGMLYFNVHTSAHPGGEIRGQLMSATGQRFTVALDGAQETPAVTTPANATGWAILSPDAASLKYEFTYAQLETTYTASHFHVGAPGVPGGVVHPFSFSGGNTATGEWTGIPDSLIAALLKGNVYANIHSVAHPGGEIRGQLYAEEAPVLTVSANAAQETPPTGTEGRGTGYVVLDSSALKIHHRMTITGMSGAVTGSHFHVGAAGVPGPVIHPITFTDSLTEGDWLAYPDSMITLLMKNQLYLNVHTANHPGGEIRGQVMFGTTSVTSVEPVTNAVPRSFQLEQNYPNPFNPSTNIQFALTAGSHVTLKVFNLLGQEVATLLDEFRPAGVYKAVFNASSLASGVYFYRLTDGSQRTIARKMLLLK